MKKTNICPHCKTPGLRYKDETATTTIQKVTLFCKCEANEGLVAAELTTHRTLIKTKSGKQSDVRTRNQLDVHCSACTRQVSHADWELTQESIVATQLHGCECGSCGCRIEIAVKRS